MFTLTKYTHQTCFNSPMAKTHVCHLKTCTNSHGEHWFLPHNTSPVQITVELLSVYNYGIFKDISLSKYELILMQTQSLITLPYCSTVRTSKPVTCQEVMTMYVCYITMLHPNQEPAPPMFWDVRHKYGAWCD